MRRILAVLGFLLAASAGYATLPCGTAVLAQAGCCKERTSYTAAWVVRRNVAIEACQRLNKEKDDDNVFVRQGLVWWDNRCQD